jgi:hypothetical protein
MILSCNDRHSYKNGLKRPVNGSVLIFMYLSTIVNLFLKWTLCVGAGDITELLETIK